MIPIQAKLIALAVVVVGSFIAGWQVKGAFVAKRDLAIAEAKESMIKELQSSEAHIANILEVKLKDLKANEKIIERERIKLVDRPVYSNECLDADGLLLIERARTGQADTSKPAK